MKMNHYRPLILGFATVSFVLLSGFKQPGVHDAVLTEKQAASVNVKNAQSSNKENAVKSKPQKAKKQVSIAKDAELQKALDLTVPFKVKTSKNAWLRVDQNRMAQIESTNMFTVDHKNKTRSFDLDGQMIMSQEPEADKQKSLDGAAIVINLKR